MKNSSKLNKFLNELNEIRKFKAKSLGIRNCQGITDTEIFKIFSKFYSPIYKYYGINGIKEGENKTKYLCICGGELTFGNSIQSETCKPFIQKLQKIKNKINKNKDYLPKDSVEYQKDFTKRLETEQKKHSKLLTEAKNLLKDKEVKELLKLKIKLKDLNKEETQIEQDKEKKAVSAEVNNLILKQVIKLIKMEECKIGVFNKTLLAEQLQYYCEHPGTHQWSMDVLKYCLLLKYQGGNKAFEMLRGIGISRDKDRKLGGFDGLINALPSLRTLSYYLYRHDCSHGVNFEFLKIIMESIDLKDCNKELILTLDEIFIKPEVTVFEFTRRIVGLVDDLKFDDLKDFWDKTIIPKNDFSNIIATQMMVVMVTSPSQGITFPLACYPTRGTKSSKTMAKYIKDAVMALKKNGLDVQAAGFDGCVATASVYNEHAGVHSTKDYKEWKDVIDTGNENTYEENATPFLFSDPLHSAKIIRNEFEHGVYIIPENIEPTKDNFKKASKFTLSNLTEFFQQQFKSHPVDPPVNSNKPQDYKPSKLKFKFANQIIKLEWLFPKDKMDLEPVKGVCKLGQAIMDEFSNNKISIEYIVCFSNFLISKLISNVSLKIAGW